MTTIAHLSDLHFGRTHPAVVAALLADIEHHRPDVVLVSGDLTQRARSHQFAEARAFIARLPAPAVIVPGNHDLAPMYRPMNRLFRPRAKFHHHLPGHEPWPVWQDDEVIAIGLDSTTRFRWQSGKLKPGHLDHVATTLAEAPSTACRAVFLHHPLGHTEDGHAFEPLAQHGIDLALTGHVHRAHIEVIHAPGPSSLVLVQASTACSTRLREDANGYCLIRIDMPRLEVAVQGWSGEAFHRVHTHVFEKSGGVWAATAH